MSARFSFVFALMLALMANVGAMPASAQVTNDGSTSSNKEVIGAGKITYAKLAVYHNRNVVVFSKGVTKVTNPSIGIYCIKRSFKGSTQNYMGIAAVEWGASNGSDLLAFWQKGATDCPNQKQWFEVRTYSRDGGGDWVLSDEVAWTFFVP